MKKIYFSLVLSCFFLLGNAQINWQRSVANTNYPTWMSATGSTERGMAYNPTNDHMYVVTRNATLKIKVIDGTTGLDLTDVADYTGVSGGTFTLNDVETSTNGSILACNLSTATNTSAFKVYRWDTESGVPSLYINYLNAGDTANNLRLGDIFSVTGDINGDAVIFAAGKVGSTAVYKVVRWIVTGGVLGSPTVISIPALATATTFISVTPLTISANPDFLLKASGNTLYKYNADGSITTEFIDNAVIPTSANDTRYFEVGTKKYVATFIYGTESVKLVDVTGGLASASTVALSPTLGAVANGNTAGGLGIKTVPDLVDGINNTVTVYALGTNNGISGTTLIKDGAVVILANKQFSVAEAKIFPNPAGNEFQINLNNTIDKNAEAVIYNANGQQVKSSRLTSELQTISISDLSTGIYLVKIKNGGNQSTTKLIKN